MEQLVARRAHNPKVTKYPSNSICSSNYYNNKV